MISRAQAQSGLVIDLRAPRPYFFPTGGPVITTLLLLLRHEAEESSPPTRSCQLGTDMGMLGVEPPVTAGVTPGNFAYDMVRRSWSQQC